MDYAEIYRNVPDIRLFPNDADHEPHASTSALPGRSNLNR
jgi:hypothetical protein